MVSAMLVRGDFDSEANPTRIEGTLLSLSVCFNDMIKAFEGKHSYRLDRLTLYWCVKFIKRWSEGEHPRNLDKWGKYWIKELRDRGVSISDIALILNRSKSTVHAYLNQP